MFLVFIIFAAIIGWGTAIGLYLENAGLTDKVTKLNDDLMRYAWKDDRK
jgi:hypothetical protein